MKVIYASGNDQQRKLYQLYLENLISGLETIEVNSLEGMKNIDQQAHEIDYIFVSDDLKNGDALQALNFAKENYGHAKFILVTETYPTNFPEPEDFDCLNADIISPMLNFDQFRVEVARVFNLEIEEKVLYRHIPLVGFYRYNQVLCDTFVKLSDNKFVKIQKAGAKYNRDDLDKYSFKGIKHLYITDDDFRKYDVNFSSLNFLKSSKEFAKLTEEEMLLRLSDVHIQLNELAKEIGISDTAVTMAEDNTKNLLFFISDHPGIEALFLRHALLEDYLYDHSYFTSIICAEIFTKLGYNTNEGIKKLCQASIMHDITIKNPKMSLVKGQNDPRLLDFSKEEVRNYLKHPTLTANLLESTDQFSADVVEIVRYHHITPEGGFPDKIHPSRLSLLTCIFIIAHEFVSKLYDNDFEKSKVSKIVLEMCLRFRETNFKKALSAFDEAKDYLAIDDLVA